MTCFHFRSHIRNNLLIRKPVTYLVTKHLNVHRIYYNVSFLIEKSFWNKFITQSYLFIAFEFIFTLSLKHIFCLPKKPQWQFFQLVCLQVSSWQIFSISQLYCLMWSSSLSSAFSCFPSFSWPKFFWAQVEDLGPVFRSSHLITVSLLYAIS